MKIALLFPGYGSQFVGMGKELYDEHRIIQEYFEEASSCMDVNFVKLCFASSDAELGKINHAYTATFLVSSAIVKLLQEQGIKPDVVVGYNQGEFAAIFSGGGMSLPDGLYLLNKYAAVYDAVLGDLDVSAIRVTGMKASAIEMMCEEATTPDAKAFVAVYESDTSHIITGDSKAVQRVRDSASELAETSGVTIEPVSLEVELHSSFMNPVVEQFRMYLEKVDFKDLTIPLMETVGATQIEKGAQVREQVLKRITSPLIWSKVEESLEPYDVIVEVGPGTMLSSLARERYPDKKIIAINKQADIDALKKVVGMVSADGQAVPASDNIEKKSESPETDSSKQE